MEQKYVVILDAYNKKKSRIDGGHFFKMLLQNIFRSWSVTPTFFQFVVIFSK